MCTSKISVWWDIENCPVPRNVDPHRVAQNVSSTLHHANFKGPVTIDVFGDTKYLEQRTLEALSSTGITINHVPSGNKDAADKAILVAMLLWALDNPPPAHFLLISGDGDFANALHRLRMKRYNVLLARPDQPVKPALLGAATSVWYWTSVATGQLSATDAFGKMEEPQRKSPADTSTKEQSACSGFYQQGLIPCERSNGHALPPSAASKRIHYSFSSSVPQFFESTAEVSSLELNSLPTTDSGMNLKQLHSPPDEGRQTSKLWVQEPGLVKDNTTYNLLHGKTFVKSDVQPSFPETFQPVSSRPSSDSHQRSLKPSETNAHSVLKSRPIFDSMATNLPSSAPNLAQEILDSYRISLNKVIKALETLKQDGLMPTEANLYDCLVSQHEKVNLRQILDKAIEQQDITLINERPGGFWMFLPFNAKPWACVNTTDMFYEFPRDLWMDLCHFLCCTESRRLFLECQSKYEAAHCLKSNGSIQMERLSIGQIIHLLHQSIQNKNWLRLHGTEWIPLSINLQAMIDYSASQPIHNILGTKTGICHNDKKISTEISPHNRSTTISLPTNSSRKLIIFKKLRIWLVETLRKKVDYDISLVRKDFEQATGIHLDHREFGYSRFQDLILEFSDVVYIKELRKGLQALYPVVEEAKFKPVPILNTVVDMGSSTTNAADLIAGKSSYSTSNQASRCWQPAAKQCAILKKLKDWLLQWPKLKDGYDISLIRKDFQQETGILLDLQSLGYAKIKDIVDEFSDDLHLENPKKGLFLLFPNKRDDAFQVSQPMRVGTGVKWIPVHVSKQESSEYTANSDTPLKQVSESHSKDCPPIVTETMSTGLLDKSPEISPPVKRAAHTAVGIRGFGENEIEAATNIEGTVESVVDSLFQPPVSNEAVVHQGTAYHITCMDRTEGKGGGETVNSDSTQETVLEHLSKTSSPVSLGSTIQQKAGYRDIDIRKSEQEGSEKLDSPESTPNRVLERLQSWLGLVMRDVQDGYDITKMHGDFLAASGIDLNTIDFGLDKLKDFLLESSDITWLDSSHAGLWLAFPAKKTAIESPKSSSKMLKDTEFLLRVPAKKAAIESPKSSSKMLKDTEFLLLEVVPRFKEGYPVARFKLDFQRHFGYELDHSSAGFSKLGNYLKTFKFVSIESAPGGSHKMLYLAEPQSRE